jgi:hypothetical protein
MSGKEAMDALMEAMSLMAKKEDRLQGQVQARSLASGY